MIMTFKQLKEREISFEIHFNLQHIQSDMFNLLLPEVNLLSQNYKLQLSLQENV